MKIDLEKQEKNMVKLNITIPAKDAVDAYNNAARRLAQYVNIPGFRKGKAPRNIVEQNVGEERIKHEALEYLLPKAFQKAVKDNDLDIVTQPYVESYNFKIGEDVTLVAKVELRPEVTLGDYKGLTIEVKDNIVTDEDVQKSLNGLLQQHAKLELVVDRKTKDTDIINLDFEGFVNGEKIQNGDAKGYPMDLANSNFIPGFAEQLIDKPIGEEFDINVTFPESYHEAKLAGQPAVFKIKINEIKEKITPELNDEFAEKVGFKTVDELKEDIKKYLDMARDDKNQKDAENAVFEKVLEGVKVDIQDTMIEREAQSLLEDYKQKLTAQGFKWEQAVEAQGLENIEATLREDAVFRIKNSLVIDQIAKTENIKIESSDFDAKLAELGAIYQMDNNTLMKQIAGNPSMLTALSQQALNEKIAKFLVDNNTIKFVESK